MERILAIPEAEVERAGREHRCGGSPRGTATFEELLERHFELVAHHVARRRRCRRERRLLIGAYFTHEYSVEGAALFNPSIVLAPDQSGVRGGASASS